MLPPERSIVFRHGASRLGKAQFDRYDAIFLACDSPAALKRATTTAYSADLQTLSRRATLNAGEHAGINLPNKARTWLIACCAAKEGAAFAQQVVAARAVRELLRSRPRRVLILALNVTPATTVLVESAALALASQAFELPRFKSRPEKSPAGLPQVTVSGIGTARLAELAIEAEAQNLARWLTALPPNKLDAAVYRDLLRRLSRQYGLSLTWHDERLLKKLGAGAFLAVAAGNAQRDAAAIAKLSYRPRGDVARRRSSARKSEPARSGPDLALIGKGILFDTGGTNLKAHRSMLEMHIDMAGSAVALASLIALARSRAPFAVDAWLAITENRIGPTAYMPQQVVTAANGVTIQVIHTDAEGRMALADTLALAGRTQPRCIVDYATLTGSCLYALTERMSGLFSNDADLTAELLAAGRVSGERLVAFPIEPDYDQDLESKVADVLQCTVEGKGDHILAARFLLRFVPPKTPWAHIDLASALRTGGLGVVSSDITGFGVRLTLAWLRQRRAATA